MITDITDRFEMAAAASAVWTHTGVATTLEALTAQYPGARVDWEPGDEEWARVIVPDANQIIALICARIPLGFLSEATPPREYVEGFVWITIRSVSDASFKIDPEVLDRIFERHVSRNLDYDAVSANDVWWATV